MCLGKSLIALSICLMSGAVLADSGTTEAGDTQAKSRNDPDRVVCRTENEIGSLVHKKKTCMTVAQWREVSAQTGNAMEKNTAQNAKPGGG